MLEISRGPKLGAVAFVRCSAQQIKARAEQDIRKELKEATGGMSFAACVSIGWLPLFGTIAFFFGPFGIVAGALLWALSVGFVLFGSGAYLWGHVGALDPGKVAGASYRWRNMCEGKCPICRNSLLVSPPEDVAKFRCPKCRTLLDFNNGFVSPA